MGERSSIDPADYGPMHACRLIWSVMPETATFEDAVAVWDMVRMNIIPEVLKEAAKNAL